MLRIVPVMEEEEDVAEDSNNRKEMVNYMRPQVEVVEEEVAK